MNDSQTLPRRDCFGGIASLVAILLLSCSTLSSVSGFDLN